MLSMESLEASDIFHLVCSPTQYDRNNGDENVTIKTDDTHYCFKELQTNQYSGQYS